MDLILYPPRDSESQFLNECYELAVLEAIDLVIVSAYLTDWGISTKLNKKCIDLSFIVGTDFGITRKQACMDVLKWLPANMKCEFRAADKMAGFHPKLVAWKNNTGCCKLILGSSNLTKAAFLTNYEANIFSDISTQQFESIKEWVEEIKANCSPISEKWIEQYHEAARSTNTGKKENTHNKTAPVIQLTISPSKLYNKNILQRRNAQERFADIAEELKKSIKRCCKTGTEEGNELFYTKLMNCWGNHKSRFQGKGFEILGKNSKWYEVCDSLSKIFDYADRKKKLGLDSFVKNEIDRLAEIKNPTRGSWLSEMLCHYFPDRYPLLNAPVKDWLVFNKYAPPKDSSEGAKYIDLAIKMRQVITDGTAHGAKNLPELDNVIWQWHRIQYPD
ncbi:MAG: phospholipase D family protein [Deltaproteobacteria bacterium]|nr:phospholipase D family protein [Deltaproteobacteria bacterium]